MKNVIQAYGVLASPLQLSAAFTSNGVSHVIIDSSLQARPTVKDVARKQPAWPVIIPSIKAFKRHWLPYDQQILYVCGSMAELQNTNLRIIKDWKQSLQKSLRYATFHPLYNDWELVVKEPTMEDFVSVATKPSFLNHIQAEIYKLTPYDLRKTVQAMVISYLAGVEGFTKLRQKLNSSYKLERLKALMADPQCQTLRNAVADYRKIGDEEQVAKAYGVETFEIMYLFKSSAKKAG
jgi:hypothetical protein